MHERIMQLELEPQRTNMCTLFDDLWRYIVDGIVPTPFTMGECQHIANTFDILTGTARNDAYHLLWYAREFALGREPITKDRLNNGR